MDGLKSWDTAYEWKAVSLLTVGFGLVGLDRWIIAPLAPAMLADLKMTPQDVNNLVAVLGITWGLSALVMGNLSDRIGRKRVLIPAIILFSLLSGFSGMASGFLGLLAVRGVMGVSEGAFAPTSFAATAEASKPSRRGFNQGLQQSSFALFGLGFGPLLATQLLHFATWRVVFMIVAIPGLIVSVLLAMVVREPVTTESASAHGVTADARRPTRGRASLGELFRHRNVALGMLALLCSMTGIFVLSANTPIYLTQYLHLPTSDMGLVTSAIGFGGFLGQWALSAFSDLFGRRTMALLGFSGGAVFLWLFIHVGASSLPVLFLLLLLCSAFAFGLLSLITGPIATEAAPLGLISTAAGVIIGTGEIFGGGVAPAVAGAIAGRYGIQYTLYLALAGLVVGAVLSLFLQETAPRLTRTVMSDLDKLEEEIGGVARV